MPDPYRNTGASTTSCRSRLDQAVRSMSDWTEQERAIFVASFISNKPWQLTAHEMGMSQYDFYSKKKSILRRFMLASKQPESTHAHA